MVGIIIHHEIVSPELLHIQLTPGGNLFAAAQAKGVLDLVANRLGSATVFLVVVDALALIESLLGPRFLLVRLGATGGTVGGIRKGLLDLVLGGLSRVRSDLLLSLSGKVL